MDMSTAAPAPAVSAAAGTSDAAYRARRILGRAGFYLSVVVIMSPALFVFLWMLSLALKNDLDNTAWPPVFIPNPPTLANFEQVLEQSTFGLYLWNSIIVSTAGMWLSSATVSTGRSCSAPITVRASRELPVPT